MSNTVVFFIGRVVEDVSYCCFLYCQVEDVNYCCIMYCQRGRGCQLLLYFVLSEW